MSEASPPTDPQPKMARDMDPAERAQALAAIKLAARTFEPMPTDVQARDMTPEARAAFLREVNRRWG
jgi:hypothetical protein